MTEGEFRAAVKVAMRDNPRWRYGQAVYNVACGLSPLADVLCGTDLDPFYYDERVEAFVHRLRDHGAFDA